MPNVTPMLILSAFPEELLETVLSYCVVAPARQESLPTLRTSRSSQQIRSRLAFLLVSKRFCRICTPLFYHTIHIKSPKQLQSLLTDSLFPNTFLASYIRRIVIGGVWAEAGELLQLCSNSLRFLDITLDTSLALTSRVRDLDAEDFSRGLFKIESLTHIVVRKPGNVYLTQSKPAYVLSQLAKAVEGWEQLEHADLAFRLSDDSGGAAGSLHSAYSPLESLRRKQPGPITQLIQALSTRPKLHTFSTSIPNVWNDNILRVSQNPALERIILVDGTGMANIPRGGLTMADEFLPGHPSDFMSIAEPMMEDGPRVTNTGHFLIQAKKHGRLSELIRAGTSIIRSRAQTLGTHSAACSSTQTQTQTTCQPTVSSHEDRSRPRSISSTAEINPAPSPRTSMRNSWVYYLSAPASALASLAQLTQFSAPSAP